MVPWACLESPGEDRSQRVFWPALFLPLRAYPWYAKWPASFIVKAEWILCFIYVCALQDKWELGGYLSPCRMPGRGTGPEASEKEFQIWIPLKSLLAVQCGQYSPSTVAEPQVPGCGRRSQVIINLLPNKKAGKAVERLSALQEGEQKREMLILLKPRLFSIPY